MSQLDIFLVDDQKITNFINRKLIDMAGIGKKIHDFINPLKALEALHQHKPQLILLDLNMPQLNGWEFIEKMEDYQTDAKVVIVTSSTSQHDLQKAKEYHRIVDYLVKPLNDQTLKNLVNIYDEHEHKKKATFRN